MRNDNRARVPPIAPAAPLQIRSEGQRLLLDVPGSLATIASKISDRTHAQSVLEWRNGVTKPTRRTRLKILSALGIPVDAWDARPNPPGTPAAPATASALELPTDSTMDGCMRLLALVRADMSAPNILPSERVKLMAAEARILKFRAELEARAELSEDRFVNEHPAWIRIRNELARVLSAYPEAARAVAEALERLGA